MLDKLKRRLGIADSDTDNDALLGDLIADAQAYVKAYTGRAVVPALLEPAVIWFAAADYNQLGLEGEKTHSEGAVSHSIEMLPEHLRILMNRYRVGKVGNP